MKKKIFSVGFLTLSMVAACQAAEKTCQVLGKQRTAINESAASPTSKRTQQKQLEKTIQDELRFGSKKVSVKEKRILQVLQHRVRQDQKPKTLGRTLIFD
jgi:hypothetical protein